MSKDGWEYIVTKPDTPRPWINYLTNEQYCAVISATGGGYSFYKDSKTERLLWFMGPNLFKDRPGRYVFIRDEDKKDAWSINWQPLKKDYTSFETRVGVGYQVIKQERKGVAGEITYFVPQSDNCEVWIVKVKNKSRKGKNISIFGYVEWFIGCTDYMNFYNIQYLWNRVGYDPKTGAIVAKKTAFYEEFNIRNNPYALFFGLNEKADGWDANKYNFLGRNNTEENPEGILMNDTTQSICDGEEGIGVLKKKLALKPGEEKVLVFVLGQARGSDEAEKVIKKYKDVKTARDELENTKKVWRDRLSKITVETPDDDFNKLVNIWVKYQLYICNFWSRSPSFYHEGQGGRGYRDSSQDAEGILSLDPQHSKEKIKKIAALIRRDGTCAPGWSDTYGPYHNRPFKDHPTWLTPTVASYVKETGDVALLKENLPWLKDKWTAGGTQVDPNWKGGSVRDGEGTLFDHLLAQLNFTFNDVSVHGIPRVGEADWNDALDMAGRRQIGESVWLGMALVRSLKILAELADILNKSDIAADLRKSAGIMTDRINKDGWDKTSDGREGEWYVAGFNDDLVPFGSSKNNEGKIFLNSQSWAILSGVVTAERLPIILRSIDKNLDGKHGLALLSPAYTVFDPGLGRIAMFSRGTKENGAVFGHAHNFMVAAYLALGMGTKSYETYCRIMPNKQRNMELYKTEPYAFAEYLVGPDHPYAYGEGSFTWLTGTAGWAFMNATELMLGARRDYDGLRIDPCIPKYWKKCGITRPFRGATYEITIENPQGIEHGVKELFVDGEKVAGNLIKPHGDGKTHKIRAIMGM